MPLSQKQKIKQVSTHRQEQVQKLEHKLQVAMALLAEKSLVDLEEQVRKELDENPALEEQQEWDAAYDASDNEDDDADYFESEEIGRDADYDKGRADAPNDDDGLDLSDNRIAEGYNFEGGEREFQIAEAPTFYDSLEDQLIVFDLTEEEHEVMRYLIGSLDNNGYLLKALEVISDELFVYAQKDVSVAQLERLLGMLQTLEPLGVGARNEQECLLLQLRGKALEAELKDSAITAVEKFYDLFIHKKWDSLQRRLRLNDETFEKVLHVLTRLNLKPGADLNDTMVSSAPTIIPDFIVKVTNEGEVIVELNNGNVPELCISPSYLEMVRQLAPRGNELSKSQRDELVLVQDKINAADNFINTMKMRALALKSVGRIIVQKQRAFFLNDDDESLLTPMKLSDISDALNIHVSTVSRVVRSKYLQTDYGTYPLKYFFSSSFISQKGEEQSAHLTRLKLEEVVAAEDKRHPLSDEQIAEAVTALGFPIARRTATKYREMLGIPEKRLRKQG